MNLTKKLLFISLLSYSSSSIAASCTANGAGFTGTCTDTLEEYNVTMKSVRLHQSGAATNSFITIAEKDSTFDIASAGANSNVGDYVSNATVPFGTYDQLVFVIDTGYTLKGGTTGGSSNPCATDTGGSGNVKVTSGSSTGAVVSATESNPGGLSYIDGTSFFIVLDSNDVAGLPITVEPGDGFNFSIEFNMSAGIRYTYAGGSCTGADLGDINPTMNISNI